MFLQNQKPTEELSLDTRKEAMVESGFAELNTYPFNQSTLKVGEEQKINLQLNTKTKSVDAIELIFEIVADKGLLDKNKIKFTGVLPPELEISKQEVVDSICEKDCYTVTLLLNIKDPAVAFSTHDQMQTISQLSFTPTKEGSLKIKISQDSTVIERESSADILQKPSVLDFQYYVTNNGIDRAQCYFQYTSWGECKNGWQTRQYSTQPERCQWYKDETLEELSQKCVDNDVVNANSSYFYLYSNDSCLNQPSDGSSLYIIWNDNKYDNVTYIDVSASPDFGDFYHKKVEGNIDQTSGDWLIVNAKNFTHATENKGPLSFEPNKEYFFRLYSTDNGGQHISSVRYYITYCSGDQSSYKNCNDACDQNSDQSKSCAPGLTCFEGICRNEDNPSNNLCLATPGIQTNDRSCNQYCANNNDCEPGLSCFWNRCRNPKNLASSSCEVPSATTATTTIVTKGGTNINSYTDSTGTTILLPSEAYDLDTNGCNQGCNNNHDCDANMRCYKGKCRLADNPEEITCNMTILADSEEASGSSMSAAVVTPTAAQEENTTAQSGFDKFFSNFSWQWLAFAGIILLVAVALVIASIAKAKKDPWKTNDQVVSSTAASNVSQVNKSETLYKSEEVKKPGEVEESTDTVKIPEDKPLQL